MPSNEEIARQHGNKVSLNAFQGSVTLGEASRRGKQAEAQKLKELKNKK